MTNECRPPYGTASDVQIRMWAMDRALDSFSRKDGWRSNFFNALVLYEWATSGDVPPFTEGESTIDIDLWARRRAENQPPENVDE